MQPDSIKDSQQRSIQECRAFSPETIRNVPEQFEFRLDSCLENNGNHFQHFIELLGIVKLGLEVLYVDYIQYLYFKNWLISLNILETSIIAMK